MKQRFLYLTITLLCSFSIFSQTIEVELPANANKELTFCFQYGVVSDTVSQVIIDDSGKATIKIPGQYRGYKGMATLYTDYGKTDFIVANENMVIRSEEKEFNRGLVTFRNSKENETLKKWFNQQQKLSQKANLLTNVKAIYDENDTFYPLLKNEIENIQNTGKTLEKELSDSPLYAAQFFNLYNILNYQIAPLSVGDSLQVASLRTYIREELDINALYTSGLWFPILNGILPIYNTPSYRTSFSSDMALLLDKTSSQRAYETLSKDLLAICRATKKTSEEIELMYHIVNDERINQATELRNDLISMLKLVKGSKAPSLNEMELPKSKIIIMFYESGCNSCVDGILELISLYPQMKAKGYEVISISADSEDQIFRNTAANFPWKYKYCDLNGFSGKDFLNYGVMGTPTFYQIDNRGIVQGRYTNVKDIIF